MSSFGAADVGTAPGMVQPLLEALLDSWDRNNTILLNLLRALPEGGLEAEVVEMPSLEALAWGSLSVPSRWK